MQIVLVLMMVASLLGAFPVMAAALWTVDWKNGTESETAVSGVRGTIRHSLDIGQQALRGLTWSERYDRPCYFKTLNRDLDDGKDLTVSPYWNGCGDNWGNTKQVDFDNNARYYVRGLAVCDSKNAGNDRVKGIRIYAAKVWKTKKVIDPLSVKSEAKHANCDTWRSAVYCPSNAVAHGAVLFYDNKFGFPGTSAETTGIVLLCREVDWR